MKPETSAKGVNREAAAGLVLLAAAVLALIVANSPLRDVYERTLAAHVQVGFAPLALSKEVIHWVNDGLMAVFFFLVGLELKREAIRGALSKPQAAMLPIIGALGGMIVPAVIYASINWDNAIALRGWAIPAATDIAFAVGVMALLGNRVPPTLKVFLLALAIIDDLGTILVIALFYTDDLSLSALSLAAAGVAILALLNHSGVMRTWPYLLVGAFLWVCVLKSGVHATLAGVATALAIPLTGTKKGTDGPLEALEHNLSPWVNFLVLPIFAFANAGLLLRRYFHRRHAVANPDRHRVGAFPRQAPRHIRRRTDGPRHWFRGNACRSFTHAAFRHSHSRRHRFYDEPVYRHAGIPRA